MVALKRTVTIMLLVILSTLLTCEEANVRIKLDCNYQLKKHCLSSY